MESRRNEMSSEDDLILTFASLNDYFMQFYVLHSGQFSFIHL